MVPFIHYNSLHVLYGVGFTFYNFIMRIVFPDELINKIAVLYNLADLFYSQAFVKLGVVT